MPENEVKRPPEIYDVVELPEGEKGVSARGTLATARVGATTGLSTYSSTKQVSTQKTADGGIADAVRTVNPGQQTWKLVKMPEDSTEHLHDDDPWCDWCDEEFEEGQEITVIVWELPSSTIAVTFCSGECAEEWDCSHSKKDVKKAIVHV